MVTTGMRAAMVIILLLCAGTIAATVVRLLRRREIAGYDARTDLGAHLPQALGMIAMTVVMGGWVSSYGPRAPYVVGYLVLTVVFAIAALIGRSRGRAAWWHALVPLLMAYTFTALDVTVVTWVFLVLLLLLAVDYVGGGVRRVASGDDRAGHRTSLYLVGISAHVTIPASMALMLVTMQWPQLFG